MPTLSRRLILAAALASGSLAVAALPVAAAPGVAAPDDMTLGKPTAPIKIVEYASMSCPHCAHFHETVFPTIKAKYIDTGRAQFTLKELLTPPQQISAAGFLMARCLGPTKYFKVVDEVFKSQSRWKQGSVKPIFLEIAAANGMSEAQFDACLTDPTNNDALGKRVERSATQDGVNSTPTVFVNGKMVGDGNVPTLAEVEAAIVAASKAQSRRR